MCWGLMSQKWGRVSGPRGGSFFGPWDVGLKERVEVLGKPNLGSFQASSTGHVHD
jgi:hypothetical protein